MSGNVFSKNNTKKGPLYMKSKLFFTFIFLLMLFTFSYALTAHKNSLQATPDNIHDNGHEIGGEAARMVFDEQANAVRVLIDGQEKVRIDVDGVHVIDGGYFHEPAPAKTDDAKGESHDQ